MFHSSVLLPFLHERRQLCAGLALITPLVLCRCSGSDETVLVDEDGADVDEPSNTEPAGTASGAQYLLSVRVTLPEGNRMSYFLTLPSLEAGTTWTLEDAHESGIDGWMFGREGETDFWQAGQRTPTIVRWHLNEDGTFERGTELDLSPWGLDQTGSNTAKRGTFLSDDRAYFLAGTPPAVIVWNPEAMEFVDLIELEAEEMNGFLPEGTSIIRHGDKLLAAVHWEHSDDYRWGDAVRLFEIDPTDNSVLRWYDEERCATLSASGRLSDGTQYFSPESPTAQLRSILGADYGHDGCALRILPDEMRFDDAYNVDVSSLVGGRPVGTVRVLNDEVALMDVWHSDLAPELADDQSNFDDVYRASAFRRWRWAIGSDRAELLPGEPFQNGSLRDIRLFEADGALLLSTFDNTTGESRTGELASTGEYRERMVGPGQVVGLVRVR